MFAELKVSCEKAVSEVCVWDLSQNLNTAPWPHTQFWKLIWIQNSDQKEKLNNPSLDDTQTKNQVSSKSINNFLSYDGHGGIYQQRRKHSHKKTLQVQQITFDLLFFDFTSCE